jgi:hypothetical protein
VPSLCEIVTGDPGMSKQNCRASFWSRFIHCILYLLLCALPCFTFCLDHANTVRNRESDYFETLFYKPLKMGRKIGCPFCLPKSKGLKFNVVFSNVFHLGPFNATVAWVGSLLPFQPTYIQWWRIIRYMLRIHRIYRSSASGVFDNCCNFLANGGASLPTSQEKCFVRIQFT